MWFLTWLDGLPARYWTVAWLSLLAVALSAIAVDRAIGPRWLRHPSGYASLLLLCLLAFRWPVLCNNQQLPDPDESQMMAGAMTLRHDPHFWRSVDGTTHGPLVEWPLVVPLCFGAPMDYTLARTISVLMIWISIVAVWLLWRHVFDDGLARVLVLPLLAVHALIDGWNFTQYGSEHVPNVLVALASCLLLAAWDRRGQFRSPRFIFAAGIVLGAVPFAKLQAVPLAAWATVAGVGLIFASAIPLRQRWQTVGLLVLGGVVAPLFFLTWVFLAHIWPDFWQSYIVNNLQYAGAGFTLAEMPGKFVELTRDTWGFGPFVYWVIGFGVCGLLMLPRFQRWHRRLALFAFGLLLASIYAAMAPGRMFMHYLQLVIFPAAFFSGSVAAGAAAAFAQRPGPGINPATARLAVVALFCACGILPQIWWRTRTSPDFFGRFTETHGRRVHTAAGQEIRRHAQPGERLAIWGWMPLLWVETGLIQGTREGNTYRQVGNEPDRDYYRTRFLYDLRRYDPPVFVDSVGGTNFILNNRETQGHETFSELRDYIAARYRLMADIDGTRIYLRNDRS